MCSVYASSLVHSTPTQSNVYTVYAYGSELFRSSLSMLNFELEGEIYISDYNQVRGLSSKLV